MIAAPYSRAPPGGLLHTYCVGVVCGCAHCYALTLFVAQQMRIEPPRYCAGLFVYSGILGQVVAVWVIYAGAGGFTPNEHTREGEAHNFAGMAVEGGGDISAGGGLFNIAA